MMNDVQVVTTKTPVEEPEEEKENFDYEEEPSIETVPTKNSLASILEKLKMRAATNAPFLNKPEFKENLMKSFDMTVPSTTKATTTTRTTVPPTTRKTEGMRSYFAFFCHSLIIMNEIKYLF